MVEYGKDQHPQTETVNTSPPSYPGSYGYEAIDTKTFREWGVTYVKFDGCNVPRDKHGKSFVDQYMDIYRNVGNLLQPGAPMSNDGKQILISNQIAYIILSVNR